MTGKEALKILNQMITIKEIQAEKCHCNNGYYYDHYVDGKKGCPACDPELGSTVEIRLKNYKKLISTPLKLDSILDDLCP